MSKLENRMRWIVAALATVLVIVTFANISNNVEKAEKTEAPKQTQEQPKGQAKWETEFLDGTTVDPSTASIRFRYRNVGTANGTAFCTVHVQNPTGKYNGRQSLQMKADVAPGESSVTVINVNVSNEGAMYAKEVTITCS